VNPEMSLSIEFGKLYCAHCGIYEGSFSGRIKNIADLKDVNTEVNQV